MTASPHRFALSGITPGRWNITDDSPIDIISEYGVYVCQMSGSKSNPQSQADARLIAAATDLYEACRELMHGSIRDGWAVLRTEAIVQAQAALTKADGRPRPDPAMLTRNAGEPTPPLREPHPALPDANHKASPSSSPSPARSRTEGEEDSDIEGRLMPKSATPVAPPDNSVGRAEGSGLPAQSAGSVADDRADLTEQGGVE